MLSIAKTIQTIQRLKGTKGAFTMEADAIRTAVAEGGEKANEIYKLFSGVREPAIDVAYKASPRGFTVGALTFRDGKKVIGTGAVSGTGLGTENSVIKYRLNVGQNGSAVTARGWLDNTKEANLDEFASNVSRKDGVTSASSSFGGFSSCSVEINEKELGKVADRVAGNSDPSNIIAKFNQIGNTYIRDVQSFYRQLFAGKEPSFENVAKATEKATEVPRGFKTLKKMPPKTPFWEMLDKLKKDSFANNKIEKEFRKGADDSSFTKDV